MFKRIIAVFTILFPAVTLFSLLLAAGLKSESVSSRILPHYSRYNLAMDAIIVIEAEPQPLTVNDEVILEKKDNKPIMVTVLGIDSPSWPVMIDFLKSEIAIRKSDRNYPIEKTASAEDELSDNTTTPQQNDEQFSKEINFYRIKTIMVVRVKGVTKSGNKPIEAPYRTFVKWPAKKWRRVYDFLSFEEFRLDIKKMLVGELELYSYILAIIGFLGTIGIQLLKKYSRHFSPGMVQKDG